MASPLSNTQTDTDDWQKKYYKHPRWVRYCGLAWRLVYEITGRQEPKPPVPLTQEELLVPLTAEECIERERLALAIFGAPHTTSYLDLYRWSTREAFDDLNRIARRAAVTVRAARARKAQQQV